MLYREIIAVCSQIHTKHINTLCGQNVELLNVKPGGTHSDHWAVKFELPHSVNSLLPTSRPIHATVVMTHSGTQTVIPLNASLIY